MATVGKISVSFAADIEELRKGVGDAVGLIEKLSGSASEVSVKADTKELDKLAESAEDAKEAVEDLSDSIEESSSDSKKELTALEAAVKQFADSAADGFSRSTDSAIEGSERYTEARTAVLSLASAASESLTAISSSASAASSAVAGLSGAFSAVTGGESLGNAADATIVAAGRINDAYETIKETLYRVIPGAAGASTAAVATLAGTLGGFSTIVAAAGGSTAAAAIAVASLSSAVVSGVTAVAAYAGVLSLARFATSGMSDEAQEYVQRAAEVSAVTVAGIAASAAGAAAFRLIATSIWSSGSASAAFTAIFAGVVSGLSASIGPAVAIASALGQVAAVTKAVNAASTGSVTAFAEAIAISATFAAGLGALHGAVTAAAGGLSVLGGALAGAGAGLAAFAAALPVTIALSIGAAVAFGRVEKALRHVGDNAEMIGGLSDRFGQPVQEIEKLKIAAEQSGVALGSVVRAQQTFSQNVSKIKIGNLGVAQTREASAAMNQLGISVQDLRSKKPEELFIDVAREISKLPDATKKTQIAMDLFGRTGPSLLPLLKNLEQVNEDIGRLGGTISDLDFKRFSAVDQSFDRLRTASGALADDLAIPFTRMQEAMNNAGAEIRGGFAVLVGAAGEMIADISTPLAVLIELFARVINTILRVGAAILKIVAVFQIFATVAAVVEIVADLFNKLWSGVELVVGSLEDFASVFEEYIGDSVESVMAIGEAMTEMLNVLTRLAGLGDVFGPVTASILAVAAAITWAMASAQAWTMIMSTSAGTAIVSAATTAAAWVAGAAGIVVAVTAAAVTIGVYFVAMVVSAAATTIASCAAMHVAWLFGLGPIGLLIAGVELLVVGIVALYALGGSIVDFFSNWGKGKEEIDGATASVEKLAEVAAANEGSGFVKDMEALGEAAGASEEEIAAVKAQIKELGESFGVEIDIRTPDERLADAKKAIDGARNSMADLSIRAAKFGQAGAEAAIRSGEEFNELQRKLGAGKINVDEFNEGASQIADNLSKGLDEIAKSSPEETLKKNLELFKQLDESVKGAAKSIRDLTAIRVVDDKLLPASDEVKRRAAELQSEYSAAIDAIKKKQSQGGFQSELDQRRRKADEDFAAGRIDSGELAKIKAELDSTSAQEEASKAVEEVNRVFDRDKAKIKAEIEFADDIRRQLEDFLTSPVQKLEKQLKKVAQTPDLNPADKTAASLMLTRQAREKLVGKTAQEQLSERQRDLTQGESVGLIDQGTLNSEMQKAADEFMSAVGVVKTPSEEFASSLNNITKQFGFAGASVDEVRSKLAGNAEKLALFDRALKESRDNLLKSLGVDKSPQEVFEEQMKKIEEAAARPVGDPGRLTESEAQRARTAARRARISALGAGGDVAGQLADRRRDIAEAFSGDRTPEGQARQSAALNQVAMDRRQAAGLDATPAQSLQSGVDKVNDAFGVTGKSMAEIQAALSPEDFKEYQEAIKQNSDAVKAGLGVEKSGAERLAESRTKLQQAVQDNVITQEEANKAIKQQKDSLLSSLGISKSPTQDFEDAVERIKENASELSPDELAKGLKETRDKFLSALGIDKSPSDAYEDAMENLVEASKKGTLTLDEFAKGSQKARDTLLQSLGIPLDPVRQLAQRMSDLDAAFEADQITKEEFNRGQEEARRAMLPGSQEESPVAVFKRQMEELDRARQAGLIGGDELADRQLAVRAELQENLKPALDKLAPDRRQIDASDARSKSGVDTFFRILQGRDNPSLKAQLEVARNTKILAEAAKEPQVAPIIAQLAAR